MLINGKGARSSQLIAHRKIVQIVEDVEGVEIVEVVNSKIS